ncbi:MAG: beta-L-arabinofuranosidase domain-containing protein [bacterium]
MVIRGKVLPLLKSNLRYYASFANYDLAKIYLGGFSPDIRDTAEHLYAAGRWICRAQDAFDDGGVARSYSLIYSPYFRCKGWIPSYPETTGYIIPTMFDYANYSGTDEMRLRAIRMADWECEVQMDDGAVQGGTIDQVPTPAIFNTGQVIFGWVRTYLETGKEKYLTSAIKAGEYLVQQQDSDGKWRKNLSNYASKEMESYTYNTRTAWSLIYLYSVTKEEKYREAAVRNIEWALGQQNENGWFRHNCLSDPSCPLLHTIAYSIRGILETGIYTKERKYVEAARKASEALLSKQRPDGGLPGRFRQNWEPAVQWSCLTGNAQISIIWGRLYQHTKEPMFLDGMKKANQFMKKVQIMRSGNPDIHGGIGGSEPIHGNYGRFEVLNWAVKFFMDALMLESSIERNPGND